MSAVVVCRVLGAVAMGDRPLPSERQRRILAALVIAGGEVVSTEHLVDVVWRGDPPPSAVNSLQSYLSRLRRLLGDLAIATRPPGYALALPVDSVDAWWFEALLVEARRRGPAEAMCVLDEALGLWRGDAYAEFADNEFAGTEAARLAELRAGAELARLDVMLALGRADDAVADAVRLTGQDPYREPVWERRMRALHASGRTVEAIRVYHEYRGMLADETGLVPSSELAALERSLVTVQPSPASEAVNGDGGLLPVPMTTFVGREDAHAELTSLLALEPLITLVGPGGVGKTRLAIEVAATYREQMSSPAWLVDLVARQPGEVALAVAHGVGIVSVPDIVGALRQALGARPALVVLDNCEHLVVEAAALVEAILPFCPGLRLLATSRTRLGVAGEHVWAVEPLSMPGPDTPMSFAELCRHSATRLFLDRVPVRFKDRPDTARSIAAICAAVDALPLGIELAAALTRELPLDHIAHGLVARTSSATVDRVAGRHRSLAAAVAWGYDVLPPAARLLGRRLAVFEGGWTLAAATFVCAGNDLDQADVPALMAQLAQASLARFDPASGRYSMLDTLHTFLRSLLDETPDSGPVRDAHLAWCLQLVAAAAPTTSAPHQRAPTPEFEVEYPNVRAALAWALGNPRHHRSTARLCLDLLDFWVTVGAGDEVIVWVRQVLDSAGPSPAERAELTRALGFMLADFGRRDEGAVHLAHALVIARTLDDPRLLVRCLIGAAESMQGDEGVALAAEASCIAHRLGDPDLLAEALFEQGFLAHLAGRPGDAVAFHQESLAAGGDDPLSRYFLARGLASLGDWRAAYDHLLACEQVLARRGERISAAETCCLIAEVELARGDASAARQAYERAVVWGRPAPVFVAQQAFFDAVGALLAADAGDQAGAVATARRLAGLPVDASSHGLLGEAWLASGEVLARAGDSPWAVRCFASVLRHRGGKVPARRADALAGIAGCLSRGQSDCLAATLAGVATAIRQRLGLVTPPWFTVAARCDQDRSTALTLTEEEAVAVAIALDAL